MASPSNVSRPAANIANVLSPSALTDRNIIDTDLMRYQFEQYNLLAEQFNTRLQPNVRAMAYDTDRDKTDIAVDDNVTAGDMDLSALAGSADQAEWSTDRIAWPQNLFRALGKATWQDMIESRRDITAILAVRTAEAVAAKLEELALAKMNSTNIKAVDKDFRGNMRSQVLAPAGEAGSDFIESTGRHKSKTSTLILDALGDWAVKLSEENQGLPNVSPGQNWSMIISIRLWRALADELGTKAVPELIMRQLNLNPINDLMGMFNIIASNSMKRVFVDNRSGQATYGDYVASGATGAVAAEQVHILQRPAFTLAMRGPGSGDRPSYIVQRPGSDVNPGSNWRSVYWGQLLLAPDDIRHYFRGSILGA